MFINKILYNNLKTLNPDDRIKDIIEKVFDFPKNIIPVISNEYLFGLTTKEKILEAAIDNQNKYKKVKKYTNKNYVTLQEDTELKSLNNIPDSPIVILKKDNKFSGIVSKNKLLDYYHKQTLELEENLNTIIEGISDGLYITDGDGYTTRINSTYEKITGIKAEDVMGKHMKKLVDQGYYSDSVTLHVLEEKKSVTISHKIKTGKEVMVTGTPVFDDSGNITRVVTTVRDMEALNKMKSELQKTKKLNTKYYNEIEKLRSQQLKLNDYIIHSTKMKKIVDLAIRSGQFNSTVLIQGESGVGKEIIARIIHKSSQTKNSKNGSLIKVNCGAIPKNLLESELFGYEKGAFTGAKKNGKPGMFELAEDGTLFLDEIAELPLKLQVKLLRALQEREIIRVERFDTNKKLSLKLIELLENHDWPGNVRQLKNIIERLVVMVENDIISKKHLPADFKDKLNINCNQNMINIKNNLDLKQAVKKLEKEIIKNAMKKANTTREISSLIGVSQPTVVRKINKYNLK